MFIIEGNIGVGKSTFLTLVQKCQPAIELIPEPQENWMSQKYGQSLLAKFYEDMPRWAYTIETFAMICRARDHMKQQDIPNQMRLMERSVYSGHYCFAKNGYANGHFSDLEWDIYNYWVDFLLKKNCKPPQGFIYLQAEPPVCYERIKKRNRLSEAKITLDYVRQIHHWHERFLIQKDELFESLKSVPILIIDCNENFIENSIKIQQYVEKVTTFMETTLLQDKNDAFLTKNFDL